MSFKLVVENMNKELSLLLTEVRSKCFNDISDNVVFVLSDLSESIQMKTIFQNQVERIKRNEKKIPKKFNEILPDVEKLYHKKIYGIHLSIYESTISHTIIDIEYLLVDGLETNHQENTPIEPPKIYYKLEESPYTIKGRTKFDVNWHLEVKNTDWWY